MTTLSTFARTALAAALFAIPVAGPAQAAPEDVALLHQYLGNWKSQGAVTGPKGNTETVSCRLDLLRGNAGKVNFRGRCSLSGTAVTMTGAIAFAEATQRYEAVMTTSVGFFGEAIGVRDGDVIRFDLTQVGGQDPTKTMEVSSSFTLGGGAIDIGLDVLFHDTGERYVAKAPFTK
jgi:hypothetical protein